MGGFARPDVCEASITAFLSENPAAQTIYALGLARVQVEQEPLHSLVHTQRADLSLQEGISLFLESLRHGMRGNPDEEVALRAVIGFLPRIGSLDPSVAAQHREVFDSLPLWRKANRYTEELFVNIGSRVARL